MKINYIIAIIALGIIGSSCRKERTCTCTTKQNTVRTGFGAKTTDEISTNTITKAKQHKTSFKYANACFSETSTYLSSGGNGITAWSATNTVETTCDLK